MPNGDPLVVGVSLPPVNLATAATVLVHNGNVSGSQTNSFWVQRFGQPIGTAAVRGDNFSIGPKGGQTVAGVLGMIQAPGGDIGVLGCSTGQTDVMWGETGVMGISSTFGVVGQGLGFLVEEGGEIVDSSIGVEGECDSGIGVQGISISGLGVVGRSDSRAGVTGSSQSDAGVEGDSMTGVGVLGQSASSIGVLGSTNAGFAGVHGSSINGFGVVAVSEQGVALGASSATNGVQGESTGPSGIGVAGLTDKGAGVQGESNSFIGVAGISASHVGGFFTGQAAGVAGRSDVGFAVVGASARGFAGAFEGSVFVQGSLQVTGAKSAVVKHADGSRRALFCVESAESMLQDYGETLLKDDSIFVELPPDFAPLIKRSNYHVFLTCYGPETVYVRKRTRTGFEIARVNPPRAAKGKNVVVAYAIVGRRADLKPSRLPRVELPELPAKVTAPKIKPTTRLASIKNQRPRPLALPPRPKIRKPDLKVLAESALPSATELKNARDK
jgi:hypothetical protein